MRAMRLLRAGHNAIMIIGMMLRARMHALHRAHNQDRSHSASAQSSLVVLVVSELFLCASRRRVQTFCMILVHR